MEINRTFVQSLPTLFDHQADACAATLSELEVADRCKVIMACATGKTRVGLEVALGQQAQTVIVYFPSLALMRQTLPLWIQARHRFKGGAAFLCVCSDNTVTDAQDETIVTADELRAELHLDNKSVTTDSQAVTEFLTVPSRHAAVRIVFSTYQSSSVVRDGCPIGFAFDLGLYDEAHRTAGKESPFSASLHDSHTAIRKRVFLTATPKHLDYRSRNKKDGEKTVLFSMDNESLYGRTAYSLQIRQAIQSGIIANYKVLVSIIDDEMLAASLNHDNPRPLNKEFVAHALAIRKSMQQYSIRKVVTFHDSVADARKFATATDIRNELAAETFHVNGFITTAARTTIMQKFAESPTAVITNARCLTEGVDVPEIDMVAFLHPKKSKVDIVQAIGRALRKRQGISKTGYILLPIYVADMEESSINSALERYGYNAIFQVIQALNEQDEVVTSGIRDAIMRRSRGQRAELDFIDVTGPSYHLDVLRESISVKCIDTLGEVWWETYAELERFKETAGHANAPSTILLGKWCSKQRSLNAKGELSADRVAALDKLGFSWEIHNDAWWNNYSQLKQFFEVHGHLNMPKGTGPAQWWYAHQRKEYKAGELQPDRIAALNAISFSWAVYDNAWQNAIQSLTQFVAEHGHADVLQSTPLGRWLYKQKHTHKKGRLAPERVAELEALGVRWNIMEELWWNKLKELIQFKEEHGHADAPQDTSIGGWASSQRAAHKRGSLSPDKIAAMEAIGFKWHIKDDKWWSTFDELKQYAAEHGHCTLPALTRLGAWSHKQRCAFKTEKLPQIKIEALETIGFKWVIRNMSSKKLPKI